ncbi:hypothetical protein DV738_g648, partial [Chaetothyriales sp. CBS 135597]
MALSLGASWAPVLGLLTRRTPAIAFNTSALIPFGASSGAALPAISIGISAWLAEAWDGLLKAVPKKKTSHMKRRHRQLAGKALKDLNNINTCPGCGKPKKSHTLCPYCVSAHSTDVFSLALTPTAILSGSGDAAIKIYSTTTDDFRLAQVLKDAHRLGCHHIATSKTGDRAVSVGFGGEAKIWKLAADGSGIWQQDGEIAAAAKAGELWAVCLSADGQYLAGTTHDGRINVWDLLNNCEKIREYETKGSFGMSIDLSPDGRFTASGHESGNIYVFSTATSRLLHSLPGLVKPVRSVKFSPGSTLVAAAGDARIIGLYDSNSGEQVAHLTGHAAWITSLDWSHTGQYLLSGSLDGKVKVWDIERRTCVATHSESDKGLWTVKWLPKGDNAVEQRKAERFVTAGSSKAISIYREASGG